MESAPPTYEKATLVDYWDIVARYVPSNDLCSAALVCGRWHTTFAPHLWGNPASHFGVENDRVYVALTRFKRTLQTARLFVRSLTHTLHLPPAHAELYNGPHADWLRDILERLPNLQSLIVRGLPFFDHAALQALRFSMSKQVDRRPPTGVLELPASAGFAFARNSSTASSFGLRLLDASRCSNVTGNGLSQALSRFEALLYLDLSFTYPARDIVVLSALQRLSGLQVLKLRGISLTDDGLATLANSIGSRVRSLDIRDNQITDRGVRTLLEKCFTNASPVPRGARSPALLPYLGNEMLDIYQGEDFEGYLRNAFTGSFVSRLAIEEVPEGGLTHLYIAGNGLTAEGASGLLRSNRLHVFDLEDVAHDLVGHSTLASQNANSSDLSIPGVEKLVPVLSKYATECLRFLRIDHSVVTKDAPDQHPEEIVKGRVELGDTTMPPSPVATFELDGTSRQPDIFELPTNTSPRFELPGDPMQFVVSPAINDPPHTENDEASPMARRSSASAPECIDSLSPDMAKMSLLSPVSADGEGTFSTLAGIITPISPNSPMIPPHQNQPSPAPRARSYSSVAVERRAKLSAHMNQHHNLHPAMLPHISTLVLTDVPCTTHSKEAAERIICFIKQCAEEANLAKAQARLDYALPPGRNGQASALKQSADKIFALKRLVLEMAPEGGRPRSKKASRWQHVTTKAVTEDRDSEALWSAAETDFSFFGDEEESNFPSLEPGRFAHSFGSGEKEVSLGASARPPPGVSQQAAPLPTYDTIAMISAFRKERKRAYQQHLAMGGGEMETEGYWDGVVQVVRPGTGLRNDEETDYYGNRFIDGWLYR